MNVSVKYVLQQVLRVCSWKAKFFCFLFVNIQKINKCMCCFCNDLLLWMIWVKAGAIFVACQLMRLQSCLRLNKNCN